MQIRPAKESDLEAMWHICQAIIVAGDSLPFSDDFDRATFKLHWFSSHTPYVAVAESKVLGMYKFGVNYPGRASHVASATYLVSTDSQGQGIGRALVQHSLEQARDAGFLAMQFNYVVSTNAPAVELYKKLGFHIAGILPDAFRHKEQGLVDAYVMYRFLAPEEPA